MKREKRKKSPDRRQIDESRMAHLERWAASGLTQAEYCRRHDLDAADFSRWKKKLNGVATPGFVELRGVSSIGQPLLELTLDEDGRASLRLSFAWSGSNGERP
jgi:hypothetical protein